MILNSSHESPQETIDWVGKWFELMKARGYDTECRIGPWDDERKQVAKWYSVDHSRMDAVGAFLSLLRDQGINPSLPLLPPQRHASHWQCLKGLLAYFRFMPLHGARWVTTDRSSGSTRNGNAFSHLCFTASQTSEVLLRAKREGVSVSSLLLWGLARATRDRVAPNSGPHYWMIPVNMRGAVKKRPDTSNHLSCVWANTTDSSLPQRVQQSINQQFESFIHWGNWWVLNIGKIIGVRGMMRLLDRIERIGDRTLGTFSNIGNWEVDNPPWVSYPPVSSAAPLGVFVMTVKGRMALCLQAHSSMGLTDDKLNEYLDKWSEILLFA